MRIRLAMALVLLAGMAVLLGPRAAEAATPTCRGKTATAVVDSSHYLVSVDPNAVIVGTSGDDSIFAYGAGSTVCALGGNDYVEIYYDGSVAYGGSGNDTMYAYYGAAAYGEGGSDYMGAINGASKVDAGPGDDTVYSWEDTSWATGGSGNDFVQAYYGGSASGGSGEDQVYSYGGGTVDGGSGNDYVYGSGGDTLLGGAGTDKVESYSTVTLVDCGSSSADSLIIDNATSPTVKRCEHVSAP